MKKMAQLCSIVNRSICRKIPIVSKQDLVLTNNNTITQQSRTLLNYQIAMNAGEGQHSYVKNSSYQRGIVDVAKPIIEEEIAKKLDVKELSSFLLADYGCSTGHNSFPAMQFIIEAIITKKLETSSEFFVFFNDTFTNDYNTLFSSLPPQRQYQAVAVPGHFQGRLLPESSLHFAYSSFSVHWLTTVPDAVRDCNSPAWNKGAIFYSSSDDRKEVIIRDAYLDQYAKDMGLFLDARAEELVSGGLMALLILTVPTSFDPDTEYTLIFDANIIGSCLIDMANKGIIDEAKVDTFNIPAYLAKPEELKAILENNNKYTIERFEILNNPGRYTLLSVSDRAAFFRAILEKLLGDHFGNDIINELFDRYMKKLADSAVSVNSINDKSHVTLVVLKRKAK